MVLRLPYLPPRRSYEVRRRVRANGGPAAAGRWRPPRIASHSTRGEGNEESMVAADVHLGGGCERSARVVRGRPADGAAEGGSEGGRDQAAAGRLRGAQAPRPHRRRGVDDRAR